jgi:dihydrofolate reductase
MGKLRVEGFSISIDGFGAGPNQSLDHPLGIGGEALHAWSFPTETFQRMLFGNTSGTTGVDNKYAARGFRNVGAWILGRNMFGPVRGPWLDDRWRGWWGDNPPYHSPVFVLTHYPRKTISMEGGTTFHFVTEGIHTALTMAREAASGRDVRVGGGVATVQQFLRERLIDELHFAMVPTLLGSGEQLFSGIDWRQLGYTCVEHVATENAVHVIIKRT